MLTGPPSFQCQGVSSIIYMGAPVHWLSRSQRSVSMSSTESGFFAASLIVKEVMFFRELLSDLGLVYSWYRVVPPLFDPIIEGFY